MTALDLLVSVASDFPVGGLVVEQDRIQFELSVVLPSGQIVPFKIEARPGVTNHVIAKEVTPERLPRFCPERHVNSDGSFCINWIAGDPRPVVDSASARAWWGSLWDYLALQITASKLRRWPGPARAHGSAAEHQNRAETCARTLGEPLLSQVTRGLLRTRIDRRRGRHRIELRMNGKLLNRINLPARTLTNLQMRCPCAEGSASKTRIQACDGHAKVLATLIDSMHQWHTLETKYIAAMRNGGVRCCGTLNHCPLK